jgi:hypothetical protein
VAIVENQIIKNTWSPRNKKYYSTMLDENGNSKYTFTENGNSFYVKIEDLSRYSKAIIKVECDYCGEEYDKIYHALITERHKRKIKKDCCKNCKHIKIKEAHENKNKVVVIPDTLICRECNVEYPLTTVYFSKTNKNLIGFSYSCKHCKAKYKRKYHKENYVLQSVNKFDHKEALDVFYKINANSDLLPNNFWNRFQNADELKITVKNIIETLLGDANISKEFNIKFIESNHLYGLIKKFKSIYNLINYIYPNRYKEWEFNRVRKDFWKSEENIHDAIKWLYDKIFEDGIITTESQIPSVWNHNLFKRYNLTSLSNYISPFEAAKLLFKDKFHEWEFTFPKGYFKNKSNVERVMHKVVKLLIEKEIINNVEEIPSKVNKYTLIKIGLASFLLTVCENSIHKAFNFIFPNKWNESDFYSNLRTSDGYIVDSYEELYIHEFLIKHIQNIKYYDNNSKKEYKRYNEKYNEYYVADWLINGHIIVEYFGWCKEESYDNNTLIRNYIDKTRRKIEFYQSLPSDGFLAIYPEDITDSFQGLKNKLSMLKVI